MHKSRLSYGGEPPLGRIPNCALPERLAIFRLGSAMAPDRDSLISRPSYQMRATAREQSRAFFMEGFDHEPANQTGDHRTWGHGADTAWGRGADAVAFLTPVDAMAQNMCPPHFARKPSEMLESPPERQRVPGKTSRFRRRNGQICLPLGYRGCSQQLEAGGGTILTPRQLV